MQERGWSRAALERMSDDEFLIRWWVTFKGPPAAMLKRRVMADLLLAHREAAGLPREVDEPERSTDSGLAARPR